MRYVVLMNMKYLNSFRCYEDAVDCRDKYQKLYPKSYVEIITYDEFKGEMIDMSKVNIRAKQYWKYKVVEFDYISIGHDDTGDKIEVCKTLHKTNSKLVFWLIILCLKLSGAKYEVID